MKRGLRIPADTATPIEVVEVDVLADYQAVVGGDLELVESDRGGLALYLNETGRLDGLPTNERATRLVRRLLEPIVGDVLVLGPTDEDGDDTSLTDEAERAVRELTSLEGAR